MKIITRFLRISFFIMTILVIGFITPSDRVYSQASVSWYACENYPEYQSENAIRCGILLATSRIHIDWPFYIEGLIIGDKNSIFDYIVGLLGMGIVIASILGVVFGLRIIFFQWIYYADQYNEDKLKEIKKKAWYIALGWGALVIGFVIVSILNNQFGTNLL